MLNRVRNILSLLAVAGLLLSCGGRHPADSSVNDSEGVSVQSVPRGMELLKAIPSDAAAVMCFERCSDALAVMFDSTDVLRRCLEGHFQHSRCVVAWCYNGSVLPLVALAAPRDTSAAVRAVCESAADKGICASYRPQGPTGRGLLLLSRSVSVVESALRHLDNGASILDTEGFSQVLSETPAGPALMFWNNLGAGKWLRRDCLKDVFKRPDIINFINGLSRWTSVSLTDLPSAASADIRLSRTDSDVWFANFLEGQPVSDSKLAAVLPASTAFVLARQIPDMSAHIEARARYLDASVKLSKYNSSRSSLKKVGGKDPEEWARSLDIREIALVRWEGKSVLLVRPAKSSTAFGPSVNKAQGFPGLLFGSAFSLEDEGTIANIGRWLVIGSGADVEAFATVAEHIDISNWPSKPSRFIIYDRKGEEAAVLAGYRTGIRLNVYKPN
ncbi:MAG: hypothetical protein IJ799_03190 [Bacteroidales bacterium]|nr:hypothetical protein [Bacteroidales bacterium]